jgi:hypothetical protein
MDNLITATARFALTCANYLRRLGTSPQEIDKLKGEIAGIKEQLGSQERRIAFLEVYKEVHVQAIQRVHDLQALQENQKIKLRNLEERIESLMFLFETLENMAPEEQHQEIISLQRSLKNHLGRARSRVAG